MCRQQLAGALSLSYRLPLQKTFPQAASSSGNKNTHPAVPQRDGPDGVGAGWSTNVQEAEEHWESRLDLLQNQPWVRRQLLSTGDGGCKGLF